MRLNYQKIPSHRSFGSTHHRSFGPKSGTDASTSLTLPVTEPGGHFAGDVGADGERMDDVSGSAGRVHGVPRV